LDGHKKKLISVILLLLLFILAAVLVSAGPTGRTVQGNIIGNDTLGANNVTVIIHTQLTNGCNCSTPVSSVSYTDSNGDYVESSANLRYDYVCSGNPLGGNCDGDWDVGNALWITVNGSSGIPQQPNAQSPIDPATYNWSSYYVGLPVFADVLDWSLDPYPYWSNNKSYPSSGIVSLPSENHQFNITWQDNNDISHVIFEHNFSGGALINSSFTGSLNDEYFYNAGTMSTGTYVWRTYANDTSNNWNQSDQWVYIVQKANSNLDIYDSVEYGFQQINLDVIFYANYTNVTSGALITDGTCLISFDDNTSAWFIMSLQPNYYEYTKTGGFNTTGLRDWWVNCSSPTYDNLTAMDDVLITAPRIYYVPEFSDYAIILLILVVVGGFLVIRRGNEN